MVIVAPMRIPTTPFRQFLERDPKLLDTRRVAEHLRNAHNEVIPSPFAREISSHIAEALKTGRPFSVVRIGDGESNVLTYGCYPDSEELDEHAVESIVGQQHDRFRVAEPWQVVLRTMMCGAIVSADIVGIRGLWKPGVADINRTVEAFSRNPRGVSGYWRGIDYLMKMADRSLLTGKIITSAHLYFGVLEHLESSVEAACRIVCVTNRKTAYRRLRLRFPDCEFALVDAVQSPSAEHNSPVFFSEMSKRLGHALSSVLFLVGAGPWSEFYCTWIKERGGVAVDFGSAFDILAGDLSRPVHREVSVEQILDRLNLNVPEL